VCSSDLKIGSIAEERKPQLSNDLARDARIGDKEWAKREGLVAFSGHPLLVEGRLLGVVALFSRKPITDIAVEALQGVADGIAVGIERKRAAEARANLEAQLLQAQKMEAVGRLAGGVAHDFNNLLTAILGYGNMVLSNLKEEDPLLAKVREIVKAGERAASLTKQLLAFSRKQVLQVKILDLNAAVADMEKMLHRVIGEDIELSAVVQDGLGQVRADPSQIEQVLLNLAVNARDAMPDGGRLTIETANVELKRPGLPSTPTIPSGRYVLLAMSDTGVGMDAEVRSHIFEPFFTTKEQGKGTGLGLATVYGIVQQSEGHIGVESEPGVGTRFEIYLPRVDHEFVTQTETAIVGPLPRGGETILLVEDEQSVRDLAREVLESQGYTVLESASGASSLELAEGLMRPIDLLVTDVVMPGMGGRVLWENFARLQPNARVLFMSGYTDDAVLRHGILEPGVAFLQKPFTPGELVRKVREVLDSGDHKKSSAAA